MRSAPECRASRVCGGGLGWVAEVLGDFDDGAAGVLHFAFQVGQVRSFELVAAFEEQLGVLVGLGLLRLQRLVVERAQVERGQVRALVEVHEVGGGEEEFRVNALHSNNVYYSSGYTRL